MTPIEYALKNLVVSHRGISKRCREMAVNGTLTRVFRHVYVYTSFLTGLDRWELAKRVNILRACAVVLALGPRSVLSHHSTLVLADIEFIGEYHDVHICRGGRWGGKQAEIPPIYLPDGREVPAVRVIRHEAEIAPEHIIQIGDIAVTSLEFAAVQCAVTLSPREACVVVSGAMRRLSMFDRFSMKLSRKREEAVRETLGQLLQEMPRCQFLKRGRCVLAVADAACESIPERVLLWVLRAAGFSELRSQEPYMVDGEVFYVDFALPSVNIVIEFDGKDKYGVGREEILRSLTYRDWRQKQLEKLGLIVLRFEYYELATPELVVEEVARRAGRKVLPRPMQMLAA